MKKTRLIGVILFIVILLFTLAGCKNSSNRAQKEESKFKIVTSFHPIYIMALNIIDGAKDVSLENMTEAMAGCLHDYTLTTNDLKKLEHADVFVINGLGLEEGINAKIDQTYPNIKIVNSSIQIKEEDILIDEDIKNGHVWTLVSLYIKQVETIAEELAYLNPENKDIYEKNAKEYIEKLNEKQNELATIKEKIKGVKAVSFSDALDYLLNDMELEIIDIHIHGNETGISSEVLASTTKKMKQEKIKCIVIDKQEARKIGETLSNETESVIYEFDSGLVGEMEKGSYLSAIEYNIRIFQKMIEDLGEK